MANSSRRRLSATTAKPHRDFPLTPRADGRWCKKVRGKVHIFTGTADEAIQEWLRVKDDLFAGRKPRAKDAEGLTVKDLANQFLTHKEDRMASGELASRTFAELHATCERVLEAFGKTRLVDDLTADDFRGYRATIAEKWGPVRLGNEVQRVRSLFKYGWDAGLIDRPVRFGPAFVKPSAATMRKHRHAQGLRMFEARHIRRMLKAASVQMRAMILLGINCGFGNTDCGTMPLKALDLKAAWINFPRPKTGVARRCPLWPETIEALNRTIADRYEPKDEANRDLVFITNKGASWVKDDDRPVSKEMRRLLQDIGLHRNKLNFYALRHTFETIGGESKDQVAVNAIMGHAPSSNDMSAVYRERISDDRLQAVAEHVRRWLFRGRESKAKTRKRG